MLIDFDQLVSSCKSRTCVISVERYPDGSCGSIRVAAANEAHCRDAEQAFQRKFVPNSPYYYSLPRDKNFEDYIYRSACLGQPLHTYVHLEQMGLWVNMFLLPLDSDKEDIGYCLYSYEITPYADSEQQASLAADTAGKALETCIKLRGADKDNIHDVFNEIIEDLRQLCGAEHCSILLPDPEKQQYSRFCEATSPEGSIRPEEIYQHSSFYEIVESFDATIGGSSCVILKDENDMEWLKPLNPALHALLTVSGIRSFILFPLKQNNRTLGFLWSLNYQVSDTVRIKETLELSTFFIASEIANYQLMKQLELLSSIDLMTGCKNRNSMNNAVNDIIAGKIQLSEPYAVVFADLNGLKRINDEKGHGAGDRMVRTAAAILSQVFYDCDVYRAGGDEFMLITQGIDEEALKNRLRQLNGKTAAASDIHFAVGYFFVQHHEDIRTAMRFADEQMYHDKKQYYTLHPDKKYR